MSAKKSKPVKKVDSTPAPASKRESRRITILGFSATSMLKWMGMNGWTREAAVKAFCGLSEGGELAPSTISTGLSDGRNPKYRKGAATPSAAQVKQLKAAAK
ncbi:hypothetical protein Psta_2243 [Pirellula staleyi DSM 6068]|uniref:Uncharacterized protein n=1 Tax=Pirellula staleyi (strain ATCC 27377 / DSM 6068 / ICPB 4128) TaxID=530564 RepID=D2R2S4_PIRSD|nr:hypothetical protein [Pirellula staleyi]ADB16914.1 hypothetical protein Psta_2243 [Pirellula staleyi DSM 6068]